MYFVILRAADLCHDRDKAASVLFSFLLSNASQWNVLNKDRESIGIRSGNILKFSSQQSQQKLASKTRFLNHFFFFFDEPYLKTKKTLEKFLIELNQAKHCFFIKRKTRLFLWLAKKTTPSHGHNYIRVIIFVHLKCIKILYVFIDVNIM